MLLIHADGSQRIQTKSYVDHKQSQTYSHVFLQLYCHEYQIQFLKSFHAAVTAIMSQIRITKATSPVVNK